MTNKIIQRTYEILEGTTNDKLTKSFPIFIIALITVNVLVVIIETEESVLDEYGYFTPFEVFSSIPASMWWGVITLTTIGYGDVYPITSIGKIIAAGVAILGITVYAIPTGIMASAFTEELRRRRDTNTKNVHIAEKIPCKSDEE